MVGRWLVGGWLVVGKVSKLVYASDWDSLARGFCKVKGQAMVQHTGGGAAPLPPQKYSPSSG